jgi:hypothetical protein
MKYVYFYSVSIHNRLTGFDFPRQGIYIADEKIINEDKYYDFLRWVAGTIKHTITYSENNIVANTLTFLHEVEV